ncbi:hypothetical protein BTH42_18965 [Burkholderia sp. SRS-W-2-2016]|nr:hypothetical protein BTH42_18965 [Burkholderia sp. SRS-W-2-2016]
MYATVIRQAASAHGGVGDPLQHAGSDGGGHGGGLSSSCDDGRGRGHGGDRGGGTPAVTAMVIAEVAAPSCRR